MRTRSHRRRAGCDRRLRAQFGEGKHWLDFLLMRGRRYSWRSNCKSSFTVQSFLFLSLPLLSPNHEFGLAPRSNQRPCQHFAKGERKSISLNERGAAAAFVSHRKFTHVKGGLEKEGRNSRANIFSPSFCDSCFNSV